MSVGRAAQFRCVIASGGWAPPLSFFLVPLVFAPSPLFQLSGKACRAYLVGLRSLASLLVFCFCPRPTLWHERECDWLPGATAPGCLLAGLRGGRKEPAYYFLRGWQGGCPGDATPLLPSARGSAATCSAGGLLLQACSASLCLSPHSAPWHLLPGKACSPERVECSTLISLPSVPRGIV